MLNSKSTDTPNISVGDDLLSVSTLRPENHDDWLPFWLAYTEGDGVTSETTQRTWERIVTRPSEAPVYWLLLKTRDRAIGFLHSVVYPMGTYGTTPLYVEDLYIDQRGRRALAIEARKSAEWKSAQDVFSLVKLALEQTIRQNGLPVNAVRFDTGKTNVLAQNVYKNVGFEGNERVVYSLPIDKGV